VELQIALLLTAMITMLMTGALRTTLQTWDRSTAKQDQTEHSLLVDQFIRRHLNSMRFARLRNTKGQAMISFLGDSEQLHFVAPYPIYDNDGTLFWWTLKNQWDEENKQHRLILEYYPFSPRQIVDYDLRHGIAFDDQEPVQIVVAEATRIERVEYFFRDAEGVESWLSRWEPTNLSPRVIRLSLVETNAQGEDVKLPDIAVAPRFSRQHLLSPVSG